MIPFPTLDYPKTNKAYQRPVFDGICVTVLIAYFLHFALPALRGGFREDEMMNMGICWCAGALKSLLQTSHFGSYLFVQEAPFTICRSTFIARQALFIICRFITSLTWILCLIELSRSAFSLHPFP